MQVDELLVYSKNRRSDTGRKYNIVSQVELEQKRQKIQHRDELFRKNDKYRLEVPAKHTSWSKLVVDGVEINPSDILCAWHQHFQSLAQSQAPDTEVVSTALTTLPSLEVLDVDITEEEVTHAIRRLKLGKAAGNDGLSSEHLSYGGPSLIKRLVRVLTPF